MDWGTIGFRACACLCVAWLCVSQPHLSELAKFSENKMQKRFASPRRTWNSCAPWHARKPWHPWKSWHPRHSLWHRGHSTHLGHHHLEHGVHTRHPTWHRRHTWYGRHRGHSCHCRRFGPVLTTKLINIMDNFKLKQLINRLRSFLIYSN